MEGAGSTASLRKAAAHWSLAGDKQLLDLLQNLHERIVTKCQDANSSLEQMVNNLDSASISLQNVNNRLMALSNSQFVESRVYDDDVDVATQEAAVKEPPKPTEATSDLSKLRDSLRVLEAYHEPVHILDSDSDTVSDEEEDRTVLKPRDLYAERPLPYIIGSQQWRSKWHAGLVVEDSDTDSDTSKANPPSEQYSDSEPDRDDVRTDKPHASQRTISTNSSIGSELTIPTVGKPADIAAELARRLGGAVPRVPEPEPESPAVAAAPPKVYRPQQPGPATIFSDEPPPLDQYQSDRSDEPDQPDSEDDVFAELHRGPARRAPGDAIHQLFGNVSIVSGRVDGLEDLDRGRQPNNSVKQSSPLFDEPQDSELFADEANSGQRTEYEDAQPQASVKKPVGGISLFGNNQGATSIGAAILKRNQRKLSVSDEEIVESQQINNVNTQNNKVTAEIGSKENNQKDIINDLFLKSNKIKQINKNVEKISAVNIEKPTNKKVDLFNEDLFDDIDDIFTNIKPPFKENKESMKKSLFDDEDDDLFANVAATSNKNSSNSKPKIKSIFDSDDDLFGEEIIEDKAAKLYDNNSHKTPLITNNDSLFSRESEEINQVVAKTDIETQADYTAFVIDKPTIKSEQGGSVTNINDDSEAVRNEVKSSKVKSIFETDSDDDIFKDIKSVSNDSFNVSTHIIHNTDKMTKSHGTIEEDCNRKTNSDLISYSKSSEITIIKDDLVEDDDSLFKQVGKRTETRIVAEGILMPQNENNNTKINVSIDQFKDNSNKTDQVVTESMGKFFGTESSTLMYDSDKLLSNEKNNEDTMENRDLSSNLISTNISKAQFHSPSIFDEDEDLDDTFTKTPISNKSTKIVDELENRDSDHTSEFTVHKEIDRDSKVSNTKESIDMMKNSDINLMQSDNEHQTIKSEKTKQPALKNDKPEVVQGINKELRQETDTKLRNSLADFEVSLPSEPLPISITKESMQEEMKNKAEYDNTITDFIQKKSLFSETSESVAGEPDIFSDIFSDVPPEFERPKEPKRSKNVNALFDDDSDDEALFFKKNEIVTDEKPDVNFTSQDDRLFHIFHDEPPAMDVDFTQKSKKALNAKLEIPPSQVHSVIIPTQTNIHGQSNFKSLPTAEILKEPGAFIDSESEKNIDEAKKPVGKLKPMNFNINVNTLLPGASAKKTKNYEEVDGQVISIIGIDKDVLKDDDLKMIKSVSFEGDPESEILDNKLSKERAKIQVKRRPSSRRARKEAVRKSRIDFGDDSTDNSSSTDISKKDNTIDSLQTNNNIISNEQSTKSSEVEDVIVDKQGMKDVRKYNSNNTNQNQNESIDASISDVLVEKHLKPKIEPESDILNNVETHIIECIKDNDTSSGIGNREISENSNLITAFNKRPNVKSKVVYILNDEDIFTDSKPVANSTDNMHKLSKDAQNIAKNKVLNIVDDDELFKSGASRNTNIATLGHVYKDVNLKNNEIDNFDSNEDILKASLSKSDKNIEVNSKISNSKEIDKLEAKIDKLFVKTQNTKVKSSLFDDLSDDESELFGSKKSVKHSNTSDNTEGISTLIKKELKLPKNDAKRSLFGDESDDDDLFGVRTAKKEPSQPLSKPKEVTSRPTEPVFEDPLSMLIQEDEM